MSNIFSLFQKTKSDSIINPELINNGQQIHSFILSKIEESQSSIYIAMAYFNDQEIFEKIKQVATTNKIRIKILLGDNEINKQLQFESIQDPLISIKKYKSSGYGGLHMKSIIIDEKIYLSGSYNLTNNAKNNNIESLTTIIEPQLVNEAVKNFNQLFESENAQELEKSINQTDSIDIKLETDAVSQNVHEKFMKIFDTIVSGTIQSNDEELENIEKSGYEKCALNHGDVTTLPAILDELLEDAKTKIDFLIPEQNLLIDQIENLKQDIIEKDLLPKKAESLKRIKHEFDQLKLEKEKENDHLTVLKDVFKEKISEAKNEKNQLKKNKREFELELDQTTNNKSPWISKIKPTLILTLTFILIIFLINFYASANTILLYLIKQIENGNAEISNKMSWFISDWYDYAENYGDPKLVIIMTLIPFIFSNSNLVFTKYKLTHLSKTFF